MKKFYRQSIEEVLRVLDSNPEGLSQEEAKRRLIENGPNELKAAEKKGPVGMFIDQFKNFMIIILIAAAVVSGIIGETADTIAIMVIVIINAIIGFIQEYRAEKAMEALKLMASPTAVVIREGMQTPIPSPDIVKGDIVMLEAGMIVPADIRIMESFHLKTEEAALTGESHPVEKTTSELHEDMIPLGDRRNMAYKGTTVSYGRAKGVVVSTGMETELGRIATMLQEEEEVKTPLQKRLEKVGQLLGITAIAICAIVFLVGILRGESAILMFLTSISLAVAAIPEALPAVVTISLSLGAMKLVKQNVLIRKLPAVEALGSVTYICTDKTGTLTMNRMSVEEIYVDGEVLSSAEFTNSKNPPPLTGGGQGEGGPLHLLLTAMALSNDAAVDSNGKTTGDPTETALFSAAENAGFKKTELQKYYPRTAEIPFDSDRKCMTTVHRITHPHLNPLPEGEEISLPDNKCGRGRVRMGSSHGFVSFTKGGVEVIIDKAKNILTSSGLKDIDKEELIRVSERMAADGLRVLAIGIREWDALPQDITPDSMECNLTILAFAGIMDPPRVEAKDAVVICKSAGIKPVMITGDHPITARAIGRKIGIISDDTDVMTGPRLERLPMDEFENKIEDISVYARVAPEQKLKIVKGLQDKGEFVAMTGDGVNDAPALKRADIGIAMGITGTDVSKESAHMILLDDNFATIVSAVGEGRRIYDNIRKFFKYMLTSNSAEIWTIFLAPFLGLPIPLLPIHILWINLVTDGAPSLALSTEPAEGDVMKRNPRRPDEGLFSGGMWQHIIWVGLLMGGATLFTQAYAIKTGHGHWQTMVFTVLCLSQFGHVMAIKSENKSLFSGGIFSNKPLLITVILSFLLQLATIYMPILNRVFKTEPLTFSELMFTLVLSSVVFIAVEIEKWVKRRLEVRGKKSEARS
ncbi:MAG: cation-translocating P-type ATPase [Nitrospirae bacterium]|nr:cation-translocating P-type ATPase [Nitrospirota bacterium]